MGLWDSANFDLSHLVKHSADFDETWNLLPKDHPLCQIVFWSNYEDSLDEYLVWFPSLFYMYFLNHMQVALVDWL